jgi:hypothetical protein
VATKEHKRFARGLIEGLETRVHAGPPVLDAEILSVQQFLRQNDFSPSSDYYDRLVRIKDRISTRPSIPTRPPGKRNYGGEAGGSWMQVQSAYDHVILSTCHDGEFNQKRGRIKISHRFNQEGRIEFVELKFLRSLHACLTGEIRKLIFVKGYQGIRKDWDAAETFVLEVLPRELVFLYQDIFRCPRAEVLSWLINVGHGLVDTLLQDLRGGSGSACTCRPGGNGEQLCLHAVRVDDVAFPILEKASHLESRVEELADPKNVVVHYVRR